MRDFEDHAVTVARSDKTRQQGFRLADLRHRLTRTLIGSEELGTRQRAADLDDQLQQTRPLDWEQDMPRFAVVRHGYHCTAVDEYVGDLERELGELDQELAQLRAQLSSPPPAPSPAAPVQNQVEAEIKRVGEQTSAVLIAAHEQAKDTVREAEAEAERTLAEAKSQAASILCDANQRLHALEREMDGVRLERERLLGDVRGTAAALTELVDESLQRLPAEPGSTDENPPASRDADTEENEAETDPAAEAERHPPAEGEPEAEGAGTA